MSIEVSWDNADKTIIYTKVTGSWTWEEMYAVSEKSIDMRRSVKHPVGSIVDFREAKGLPGGAISHAKNIVRKQEGHSGTTVFVGCNFASMSLWNVLMNVYGFFIQNQDFQFATSLCEARTYLQDSAMPVNRVIVGFRT